MTFQYLGDWELEFRAASWPFKTTATRFFFLTCYCYGDQMSSPELPAYLTMLCGEVLVVKNGDFKLCTCGCDGLNLGFQARDFCNLF